MEVIELSSYTDEEKLEIAKRHLFPRQVERHGLSKRQLKISDNGLREIITGYTKESGVRVLERRLAALCRKAAMEVVNTGVKQIHITEKNIEQYLGIRRYQPEKLPDQELVGVVNGLAWTSVGGEILEVEVNVVPGTGKVELTGNLGDVMKESAGRLCPIFAAGPHSLGLNLAFTRIGISTSISPRGLFPRTGLPLALPSPQPLYLP